MTFPRPRLRVPPAVSRLTAVALSAIVNARTPTALQRLALVPLGALPLAPGTRGRKESCGGVPGRRVALDAGGRSGALLYFHGGGYVVGNSRMEQSAISYLAAGLGVEAFVPDYPLAPDDPYPAAL